MSNGVYDNKVIMQTLMAENLLTDLTIGTFQEDFQLD